MYKLLVVDDEPKIREIIREYAEFEGYQVDEAEDGGGGPEEGGVAGGEGRDGRIGQHG